MAKFANSGRRRAVVFAALAMSVCAASFLAATPAIAGLGTVPLTHSDTDVTATRVLSARAFAQEAAAAGVSTSTSAATAAYSVNTVTLATGTVVREYVNTRDQVFGVVWQGPRMPNLKDVLGASFDTFTTKTNDETGPQFLGLSRRVLHSPNLVIESQGHLGVFSGKAYLPASLPAGVAATDIQ